jgi:predicted secreted protein
MSKLNGTNMRVLVSGTAIGGTKSFTLNLTRSNIDTSSKDSSGWTNRIYGKGDWNVSFDGLYDPALTWNIEELYTMLNSKTSVVLECAVIDGTGGGLVYRGTAIASNLSMTAAAEEAVTISGTFEADGALVQGTVASS